MDAGGQWRGRICYAIGQGRCVQHHHYERGDQHSELFLVPVRLQIAFEKILNTGVLSNQPLTTRYDDRSTCIFEIFNLV